MPPPIAPTPPTPSPLQILIVDDEAPQMTALCDTLQDQGYITVGVNCAEDALVVLRSQKFDLLLTDLIMPEMDGVALLRAALEIDPQLVGIMMTGQGTISTAVEAMRAGALDYILKPFKLSAILPVLSRALAVRQLRIENASLQQQIIQHTAELEAANKELEAFSYSISHDLRVPLRAIDGYSQMLLEDAASSLSPKDLSTLHKICASASKMGELIDSLLSLSRLGRQPISRLPLQLSPLVTQVLEELATQHQGRHVDVRVGDLPDCIGDRALIKQIFVNLLSNAFKFTRATPKPVVEVGAMQQDGAHVYFVRDNGAGFNMQYAQKLFGAFQRFHQASEFEGTGVGLSIVLRIINRHGGRIWAQSQVNKGATFFFTLAPKPPN
jgi:signal transduction histidine kinase